MEDKGHAVANQGEFHTRDHQTEDEKDLEIEKLRNQCELLEADLRAKQDLEQWLKQQLASLRQKDGHWYKRLQLEMDERENQVTGLAAELSRIRQENARLAEQNEALLVGSGAPEVAELAAGSPRDLITPQ